MTCQYIAKYTKGKMYLVRYEHKLTMEKIFNDIIKKNKEYDIDFTNSFLSIVIKYK
jgi:hypothetical protein